MNLTEAQATEVSAALRARNIVPHIDRCENVTESRQIVIEYRVWVKLADARTGNISMEQINSVEEIDAKLAAANGSLKKAANRTRRAISVESNSGR